MMEHAAKAKRFVEAATTFLGCRFQLHGRDPQKGLDCVGLIHVSLLAIGQTPHLPVGYKLRNVDPSHWFEAAKNSGLVAIQSAIRSGDVILQQPGPSQHHLAIVETDQTIIHAHAGLRRVVRQELDRSAQILSQWRLG